MEGFIRSLQPLLMPAGGLIVGILVIALLLFWGANTMFKDEPETVKSTKKFIGRAMWVLIGLVVLGVVLGALAMGTNYIPRNDVDKTDVYSQMESGTSSTNQ